MKLRLVCSSTNFTAKPTVCSTFKQSIKLYKINTLCINYILICMQACKHACVCLCVCAHMHILALNSRTRQNGHARQIPISGQREMKALYQWGSLIVMKTENIQHRWSTLQNSFYFQKYNDFHFYYIPHVFTAINLHPNVFSIIINTVVCKLIGTSTYFGKNQVLLVADRQNWVLYLGFLWKHDVDY
jgi:hypothetical protein